MGSPEPVGTSSWGFPSPATADTDGLVAVGGDLEPATLLAAYRNGLFPMPVGRSRRGLEVGWWSPHDRGILELDHLKVSKSLRRSCRRYRVSINEAFGEVIDACRTIERPGGWIAPEISVAYRRLHHLGWAHSVETWLGDELVGGLYGVQVNGLFAGESMFHTATDASKVALVTLVNALADRDPTGSTVLVDVQWQTPHLATLGVRSITQREYLTRLSHAVASSIPSLAESPCANSPT